MGYLRVRSHVLGEDVYFVRDEAAAAGVPDQSLVTYTLAELRHIVEGKMPAEELAKAHQIKKVLGGRIIDEAEAEAGPNSRDLQEAKLVQLWSAVEAAEASGDAKALERALKAWDAENRRIAQVEPRPKTGDPWELVLDEAWRRDPELYHLLVALKAYGSKLVVQDDKTLRLEIAEGFYHDYGSDARQKWLMPKAALIKQIFAAVGPKVKGGRQAQDVA